jgi:HlyD family secretion protein
MACNGKEKYYDATGVFESDEVIVSAELMGKLVDSKFEEGVRLAKDSVAGKIDPLQYELQKDQLEESISAIDSKIMSAEPQVKILETQIQTQKEQLKSIQIQLSTAIKERNRIENLVRQNAAPGKQLDDLNAQVDLLKQQEITTESQISVTKQQIVSQREQVAIQNRGIQAEKRPLEKRKAMAEDVLNKSNIINPVNGTVLTRYVFNGEIVSPGKPLYKIADLNTLKLRAYISGAQLSLIRLNQEVKVLVDQGASEMKQYPGQIVWISDKAEFTPKTIQTKDERTHLVYAIKIKVANDGYLKLGMYGELKF